VFAYVAVTSPTFIESCQHQLPVTVICDKIRDPCNMAAIITTAATVSCNEILVSKGLTDYCILLYRVLVVILIIFAFSRAEHHYSNDLLVLKFYLGGFDADAVIALTERYFAYNAIGSPSAAILASVSYWKYWCLLVL